ncbi:hypothetical protein ID866_2245 [Astraeus odoratus]|nr:hypothetical protein ID866_2245 [Astraeus odoratus]
MAFDLVIGNLGSGHGQKDGFVRLSKPLVATGAARFSPRNGALEPGTLQSHVKMGAAHVDIDAFQGLLSTWRVLESEDIRSPGASMSSTRVRGAFSASSGSSEYLALLSEKQEKKRTPVPLGLVQSMRFDFGSLTFSKMITGKRYRIVIQDGSCSCLPSNGTSDSVHRTWLGKSLPISTSAYRFSLTLQHISLQRTDIAAWINGANSAIISTGSISIQSIISNWPALTAVDPLLSSSSNTRVLLDVQVTSLSFTDRLDHLLQLAGDRSLKDAPQRGIEPVLPAVLSPVPEIVLNVAIGPVTANVKCANPANAEEPIVMDLEMNGMTFDSSSSFFTGPSVVALRGRYNADNEHIPLRMTMPFHCLLHPVFLRLRSTSTKKTRKRMSRWGLESALGDTVFSLETLEVNGTLAGLGELCEEDEPVLAALNTRTLFADLHCRTEAAFVELWHPRRLEFLNNLLSVLSACRCATTSHQSPRIPPIGYSLSLSVARAVLFVTGPDVNPAADADITRGVAFSTGISSRICVVGTDHTQTLRPSQSDSQNRQKLFLPPDKLGDAISFARASEVPTGSVIFGKLMFWNTSIRSAAADQFSMDDPLMFESDNPSLHVKRIVFVQNTNIDIKYTPQQSRSKGAECDMAFTVDNFTLFFELPFVHSALVAFRTLRSIKQAIEPSILSPTLEGHSPPFTYTNIHGTIKAFRARLGLLDQKVTMRANYLDLSSSSRGLHCSVDSLLFWVPVVPPKGQANKEMSWEELGRLNRFSLSSATPFAGHTNINMDSLRVRIPYGYALANLSQAAVITLKAVRHLAKMVILGKYSPVPAPVAESAKRLPDLTVACQVLSLEAADDPFESQLGFNCRLGLEAARSRLRREEAFEAKASAVLSGQSLSAHSTHTDYQFDSNHSVPVEEARWRLNMAHSVDWILRHRRQSREREIQEDSFRQVHGSIPLKRPTKVPDLIHPAEPQRTPPLIRIILTGLRSSLSRPSFSLEGLPDFLYEQGKGIPRETSYSLLVPMHLTFTLVSLQVLLRDYPLPLLYVPPVASSNVPSLHFDSDLVIAEEMGPPVSVEWVPCLFHDPDEIVTHNAPMLIKVPKTLMPVKTYARPLLQVTAHDPVAFAWGVSYSPAIQDVVRMLESITPESRDISLPLGFWDKLRLVFHWTIHVSFKEEVRLYLKGSRDPYVLENEGAGFALCWHGDPQIKIGFENSAGELAQVTSDTMLIVIPK